MNGTILRVNNLSKKYGSKTVLNNVSFSVEKGKIYGFIGENGAGKTTTIRALTGLTDAPEGTVELFGASDKKGLYNARKKIGCLVENPILDMGKTAWQNLEMQQVLYGREDKRKIEPLLSRVGLGDDKNKKVKNFSMGMKQRLGIAMTLVFSPELLILDEPVNGLDPVGMYEVRELLRSLCEDDGITILISSHILTELYQLATDYIIISHGEIIDTLSREQLDERCSSYITLETDQTAAAIEVLHEKGVESVGYEGNSIKVYDDVPIKSIARWMFDSKILVTLLMRNERSLESYYIDLLGRN